MMQQYALSRLLFFPLLLGLGSCTTMRGKLSESNLGGMVLRSYDWTSANFVKGVDFSVEKFNHFISEADEKWLTGLLDSINSQHSDVQDNSSLPNIVFDGNLIWPLKHKKGIKLTSQFGSRWGKKHSGIDLSAAKGTPVYAIAPGKVVYAGNSMRGYGNLIILQHQGALNSYYAHNSKLKVRKGAFVKQGQRIAQVGSTGHATGTHLHFEIRNGKLAVNPCLHLPKHNVFSCKQ